MCSMPVQSCRSHGTNRLERELSFQLRSDHFDMESIKHSTEIAVFQNLESCIKRFSRRGFKRLYPYNNNKTQQEPQSSIPY